MGGWIAILASNARVEGRPLLKLGDNRRGSTGEKAVMLCVNSGADQPAVAWERAAEEVERALRGHLDEPLSLQAAATERGYTRRYLKRLNRGGELTIQDDGCVLRRHLPREPGADVADDVPDVPFSRVQLARAVADGG